MLSLTSTSDNLFSLAIARYRLDFTVTSPLALPAFAGSTLRGAFGTALRTASCITRAADCKGCALLTSCAYAKVFEPRPPTSGQSLASINQVPRPYVIEPPEWGERDYQPGDILSFQIVLAGSALDQLPLVLWAFDKALNKGVGKGDGTAILSRVTHLTPDQENPVMDAPGATIAQHSTRLPFSPVPTCDAVTLHFHAPLRLQNQGRRASATEHTPRRLLAALIRRVALINEYHGAGPLPLDFKDLAARAEGLGSEKDLRWRDWSRYSSRQQQKIDLGGVIGRWRLTGEIAPFMPFLHLGQWLHVGKEATFGLGGYRLELHP